MNIELSRPEEFSNRASLVTVKIHDPGVVSERISFELPVFENWLFLKFKNSEDFMGTLYEPMRGLIEKGEWQCIIQSNGLSEEENPVSRETVKARLEEVIRKAILPFCLGS